MALPIILASASPRRQSLLRQLGLNFQIIVSNVSEETDGRLLPNQIVKTLAERKCLAVANKYPEAVVIGADTIVMLDGEILGKPGSREMARKMLLKLNNQTHQVMTGVALRCIDRNVRDLFAVTTDVKFGTITAEWVESYIKTGEALDKAGAYAIQGMGAMLVESIRGSYSNVVGLPLFEVAHSLKRFFGDDLFGNAGD